MLYALISSWKRFAGDQRTKVYFTPDTNMFDPNIHVFATAKNQNRLQVADIDGSLGIDKHFRFTIPVEDESEVLAEFGLDNCRYITLQQGVDAACNTKFAPKQWPNEYYSRLCDICHERFPDIKLVQLGETDNNQPVEGVDLCLLGKTTIPELKAILKNSVLHEMETAEWYIFAGQCTVVQISFFTEICLIMSMAIMRIIGSVPMCVTIGAQSFLTHGSADAIRADCLNV